MYYNVVDANGNHATEVMRTIHIVDTTKPVLTIEPNVMDLDQYSVFDLMSGVTAIDNYDGDITASVIVSPASSNRDVVTGGSITRVFLYTITDVNGNAST